MGFPVLLIRDVYPGFRIQIFSIPDPWSQIQIFPSRIPEPGFSLENLSILTPKMVSKLSEILFGVFILDPDTGSGLQIRILTFYPSRIPVLDPGSRGQKGTVSRIRIRNTGDFGFALAVWVDVLFKA
jgi:hypothetical protein